MQDGPWRTRMARLAASEHGADWVINTDADEFWMPRGGTLKEVLGSIPATHGVVFALSRRFAPRPDDGASFAERMTARVSPPVAISRSIEPVPAASRPALRGDGTITVGHGSHRVSSRRWRAIHNWHPADVLHFPFRSLGQWENKGHDATRWELPIGPVRNGLAARKAGKSAARFRTLVVDDATLERGLAEGSLVLDVPAMLSVHLGAA